MSAPSAPESASSQVKRIRKRIYIPLILLCLLVAAIIGFYIRGIWADAAEKNPTGPDAGTVTQLWKKANGNVVVRCAVIVDAPPKDVWGVVTDYAHHRDFLPYVSEVKGTKQADGRYLVEGISHSRLWGDWPFATVVTHKEAPDDAEYSTLWNEEDKDVFKVSRGGWSLGPAGGNKQQTLLVFKLQIELKDYPNFMVRNVIMDRLPTVVSAMRDEAIKRKKP